MQDGTQITAVADSLRPSAKRHCGAMSIAVSGAGARHRLEFHHRRRSDPSLFNCHHVKWDCFVWLTDLNCGKVSPLLRSLLDLNNDTRRTLRSKRCPGSGTPFSTRGCGGPMNELVAQLR